MNDPLDTQLQALIYNILTGDTALMSAVTAVYDHAPSGAVWPFVTIDLVDTAEWDTKSRPGARVRMQISSWSRARGKSETRQINAAVKAALLGADLTLAGHTLLRLEWRASRILTEPDGQSFHGVVEFEALTQEV